MRRIADLSSRLAGIYDNIAELSGILEDLEGNVSIPEAVGICPVIIIDPPRLAGGCAEPIGPGTGPITIDDIRTTIEKLTAWIQAIKEYLESLNQEMELPGIPRTS